MATQKSTSKAIVQFQPLKLPTNVLPTKENVICAINFEKVVNRKTFSEAINIVVGDIVSLWKEVKLPIVDVATVRTLIKRIHQNYLNIARRDMNRPAYIQKLKDFEVYETLFI